MLKILQLVVCACLLFSPHARAQPPSAAEMVGRAYMDAYSAADWDAMAALMTDDFAFVDRTNPDPNFVARYDGRDAVVAMLREFGAASGVVELGFEFPMIFESNNVVVFAGRVNTLSAPAGSDAAYRWRSDQVTALTITGDKVSQHEDFADYVHPIIERVARPHAASAAANASVKFSDLSFLLGEWRIDSAQLRSGKPDYKSTGTMRAASMQGGVIEMTTVIRDLSAPDAPPFVSTHIWMTHPQHGGVAGVAINSLGNRKFNDGAFDDGELIIVTRGEMFEGAKQIERARYRAVSADRFEVTLEASADGGETWRDGGYFAVYARVK